MAKRRGSDKLSDGAGSLNDPGFMSPMDVPSESGNETWDKPFAVPSFEKARDPLGILPGGASAVKTNPRRAK